jgi:hypothetical protein
MRWLKRECFGQNRNYMRAPLFAIALIAAGASLASRTDYLNVQKKFQQIDKRQVKPGTKVSISAQELNAYVQAELPKVAPPGIRRPAVRLNGNDTATGTALIDFVKLRSAQGKPPSWLMRQLLSGEHEVEVTTRVRSANGKATVDLQRVEVAGIPISGSALDFLVQNYLMPNYPDAKIGRPFSLGKGVDRIEVQPGVAYVFTR